MGLSSNIVWHQTDFEGLKAILTEKCFKCSYSLENIHWKSSSIQLAFPMLSFCDIPLSDMDNYLGKYGKYTIGIKREWAEQCGFAPVWYQTKKSSSLLEIMKHRENLYRENWSPADILIWNILSTTKNYQGNLKKYNFTSYRFYDERELRYVPKYEELNGLNIKPILNKKQYSDFKKKNNDRSTIKELSLQFDLNQVVYILISSINQRNKVRELIANEPNCENIILMSYKQIREDIIGICHNR